MLVLEMLGARWHKQWLLAHYALNEDSSSPNVPSLAGMRTSTPLSLGQYVVQNEMSD